jgi:hypothetical protein
MQLKLRKVINAAAKAGEKGNQRNRPSVQIDSSKKLKPFVDPQIWKDLQDPAKEQALRGLCGLCKGDGLKTRCLTAVGMFYLVGDGKLVKSESFTLSVTASFSRQIT